MRCLTSIALLTLLTGLAHAAPVVVWRNGKMLGLYRFAESITSGRQASAILADRFRGSRHDTPRLRALLSEYRDIREHHFHHGFFFSGYPRARAEMGFDIPSAFNMQSARARDLADFAGRTAQLLPPTEHRRLFAILGELEPVYDALVWRPSLARLERYRRRLRTAARRADLPAMFARAARFYGSHWPGALPLTVVLHPVPAARGHTTAYVITDVAAVEALLDEKDLAGRLGVVFHELCHALYESQPGALQSKLHGWFARHPSPFASQAESLFNEALATALGNGWAHQRAAGRLDPDPWYSDRQIDGFARALYPTVTRYLDAGRTLDRAFVAAAVAAYKERFPDALRSYANVLKEVFLASDGRLVGVREAGSVLRRHFRVPSITRVSPLGGAGSRRALAGLGPRTAAMLIVSPGQERQLARFARQTALEAWLPRLRRKGDWVFSALDADKRPWIVMHLSQKEQLGRALELLKKRRLIAEVEPFEAL